MKNIYLLDPGLIDLDGHHFLFMAELAKIAQVRGYRVHVFSNIATSREVQDALMVFATVNPFFKVHPFFNRKGVSFELLSIIDDCYHLATEFAKVPQDGLWVMPSVYKSQLVALSHLNLRCDVSCLLCDTPSFRYPGLGEGVSEYLNLKLSLNKSKSIKIFAEGRLFSMWGKFTGLPLVKPIPKTFISAGIPRKRAHLQTIGIVGNWGWKLAEDPNMKALLQEVVIELSRRFRLVLHDVTGHWASFSGSGNINVYSGFVNNFESLIDQCDLVLLPYFNKIFFEVGSISGSQTFMNCLATATPVICPAALVGSELVRGAGVVGFESFTTASILQAIDLCEQSFEQVSANAFAFSGPFRHQSGFDSLFDTLTEHGNH